MANCSKIKALAIPENYTGDLTLGVTTALSSSITVDFVKGNNTGLYGNDATTDGAGTILLTVDSTLSAFFSSQYDFFRVYLKDSNSDPLPFVYESEEYDYMELPFSVKDCDLVEAARTIVIDESSPCPCDCSEAEGGGEQQGAVGGDGGVPVDEEDPPEPEQATFAYNPDGSVESVAWETEELEFDYNPDNTVSYVQNEDWRWIFSYNIDGSINDIRPVPNLFVPPPA